MKKAIIGLCLLFLFFSNQSFAETGNCLLFLGEWDVTIGSDTYTWTFKPGVLNSEQFIIGEDDNGTQIAILWIEEITSYMATNTASINDNYYVMFDNETRFSGYHFLDKNILIVGTVPPEDEPPSPCPARMVLSDDTAKLNILRNYRDNVLSKSASGRGMIDLYYKLGPAMCNIIRNDPQLIQTYRIFLSRILE